MTQTPSDEALLAASIDYLETQLLPTLEGEYRFKTRLVANALKTLLRHQVAVDRIATTMVETDEAARQLAQAIRKGSVALNDTKLLASLELQLRESLSINNPKWLG